MKLRLHFVALPAFALSLLFCGCGSEAQQAFGANASGGDVAARKRGLAPPTIDQTPSPTKNGLPVLTGTSSVITEWDGDEVPGHEEEDEDDLVTLTVSENGKTVCTVKNVATSHWSCTVTTRLADGTHVLTATVTRDNSTSPASNPDVFVVKTSIGTPTVDQIPSPTNVNRPVFTGTGEPAAVVTVSAPTATAGSAPVSAGSVTICQASVNAGGNWTCTAPALSDGTYTVSASQQDAAGNVSASVSTTFTIDTRVPPPPPTNVPPAPSIDSPANGAEVEQMRPTISGHTAAGTSVQVTLDGVTYTAQVNPGGEWTLLPSSALSVGAHNVSTNAIDDQRNSSAPAQSAFATVDLGVARGGCTSGGAAWPLLVVAAFLALLPRRRARVLAMLAVLAAPLAARAQATSTDVSLFRPASGGDGFASVEGARPPLAGEGLELRTWIDYAVHPLVFQAQSGINDVLVRSRTGGWLGVQTHLLGPLSVAVQLPVTYSQQGDLSSLPPSSRGPSSLVGGLGDLRLTPRLALLRQEWAGIDLATQVSLEFPTARARTLGRNAGGFGSR